MRKVNIIFDAIVLISAIFLFYISFSLPEGSGSPGSNPAIYPQIVLLLIIAFSVIDIMKIVAQKNKEAFLQAVERKNVKNVVIITLLIALFIFLFKKVPFIVLATVIIFIQCLVLKQKWGTALIIAVVLSVSVYSLFVYGLNVIL